VIGANPIASNGSMWTVPDFRGKAKALRERAAAGGDRPAPHRDRRRGRPHHFIRPGTDVFLLAAMVHTLFDEGLVRLGRLSRMWNGLDEVREAVAPFTPERVAARCGIDGRHPHAGARTGRGAARLRLRPHRHLHAGFGTLASWLIDVLNVLTGHLDAPGGAMFPKAAAFAHNTIGKPGSGRGIVHGPPPQPRQRRARGLRRTADHLPGRGDRDPGPGQVRALITRGQQPGAVGARRRAAGGGAGQPGLHGQPGHLPQRDHAPCRRDPARPSARWRTATTTWPSRSCRGRNHARYSAPVFEPRPATRRMAEPAAAGRHRQGLGAQADVLALDDEPSPEVRKLAGAHTPAVLQALGRRQRARPRCWTGAAQRPLRRPVRPKPDGLTLAGAGRTAAGIDLGPLQPRMPELLRTPSGRIELAPPIAAADLARRWRCWTQPAPPLVVIGRRDVRSNNSWMHNLPTLAKGPERCTAAVHPDDAARRPGRRPTRPLTGAAGRSRGGGREQRR
jgi:anaerobic selenocysteine-containing dehydrogenase